MCGWLISIALLIRPAFGNTLFPVTHPHHIYSTALVIIILIDNLKYVVSVWFLPWKILEVLKMYLGVQVSKTLGRLIVQTFTTHVSNHLINFPICTRVQKRRTETYNRAGGIGPATPVLAGPVFSSR